MQICGIELQHHNALSDSYGCAELLRHLLNSGVTLDDYIRTFILPLRTNPTTTTVQDLGHENDSLRNCRRTGYKITARTGFMTYPVNCSRIIRCQPELFPVGLYFYCILPSGSNCGRDPQAGYMYRAGTSLVTSSMR